jgi:hypothetical protein
MRAFALCSKVEKFCTDFPIRILNSLVGAEVRCKMSASPQPVTSTEGPIGFDF